MLKHNEDLRTLFFVALYFASLVGLWMVHPTDPALRAAWVALLCFQSWQSAVITHNTIHCPIFKNRGLNRAFQVVLTMAYGHPVSAYVPGHNLSHHKYTQLDQDVMRTTKLRFRWNLLNFLLFLPMIGPAIMRNDKIFISRMKDVRPRWYRQLWIEGILFGAVSVALLLLDWQKFLLYWYLPHFVAALGIISINYLQHDGCDHEHPYNHSRNFVSPWFNWLVFNNGYHTVHHDAANLHWSLLPERHMREVHPHIHPALEQKSIVVYMWRTLVWPGRRVNYDGTPVVLPPPVADRSWVPGEGLPNEVSLGAEG